MKLLLGLVLGLVLGGGIGFLAGRAAVGRAFIKSFQSHAPVAIVNEEGLQIGTLPVGRPVLGWEGLGHPDVGWWGCIPMLFGTGSEAADLIRPASKWSPSEGPVLNGIPTDQVLQQAQATTQHPPT